MKIAILTQPLHNNYGGLLQAYALQHYLGTLGHDAITVDFTTQRKPRLWGIKSITLKAFQKYILQNSIASILPPSDKYKRMVGQHTKRFAAKNIRTTQPIYSLKEFSYIKQYQFDAYVVGSDQVWRPAYSPGIPAFFLSFLNEADKAKRIAYASSFAVDHCEEFTPAELKEYASLLSRFDAVGVREDSAVELCWKNFGVTAEQVSDPTLLLDKSVYSQLVLQDNVPANKGDMMVYVLDKSPEKQQIIKKVADELGLTPYTVMPGIDGIYPPVTQWLRGFMDAKYVVTDSFHGVAFSIIFNKPFIAIGNQDRGLARFTSILKMFDLESRLVFDPAEITSLLINDPIDFHHINKLKEVHQKRAKVFLASALDNSNYR